MKKLGSITTLLSLTLLATISTANAKTITASATGDQYPNMSSAPGSVANRDFFITDRGEGRNIGDGDNEVTHWELDFRNNFGDGAKMRKFLKSKKTLCSAVLSLKMHPGKSNGMKGDVIGIVGLRALGRNLPFRKNWADTSMTQNVKFDLLDHYSAHDVNNSLKSYPLGAIDMRHYDDALISEASLKLDYSKNGRCLKD